MNKGKRIKNFDARFDCKKTCFSVKINRILENISLD